MNIIWDTGALSLFFADHSEAKRYMQQITIKKSVGYIPRLILAEFFYKTCQKLGKEVAQIRLVALRQVPIIEEVISEEEVLGIGMLKIKHSNLSLVDCVLVQLAKKHHATILTTENPITTIKGIKARKFSY
jgi:predicted nucleic acid-binding protein